MHAHYNYWLVLASLAVAILSSWSAFDLGSRVHTAQPRHARYWLAGSAAVLGMGLWSVHFLGMLAMRWKPDAGYAIAPTLSSLAVVIVAASGALWLASRIRSWPSWAAAGVLVGTGTTVMHLIGMTTRPLAGAPVFLWGGQVLAWALGALCAAVAFPLAFHRPPLMRWHRPIAALLMTASVVSIHFIGLSYTRLPAPLAGGPHTGLPATWLALTIATNTALVLFTAIVLSRIDRRHQHEQTSLEARTRQLHELVLRDPLTGLGNRRALEEALAERCADRRVRRFALIFVDLDGFKAVNDTHGHDAGDELLRLVAWRLAHNLRDGDAVMRLAGDEFVVLVEGASEREQVVSVGEHLLRALAAPYQLVSARVRLSASMGAAFYPADGQTAAALMEAADQAMYAVKKQGRNGLHFHNPHHNAPAAINEEESHRLQTVVEGCPANWRVKAMVAANGEGVRGVMVRAAEGEPWDFGDSALRGRLLRLFDALTDEPMIVLDPGAAAWPCPTAQDFLGRAAERLAEGGVQLILALPEGALAERPALAEDLARLHGAGVSYGLLDLAQGRLNWAVLAACPPAVVILPDVRAEEASLRYRRMVAQGAEGLGALRLARLQVAAELPAWRAREGVDCFLVTLAAEAGAIRGPARPGSASTGSSPLMQMH